MIRGRLTPWPTVALHGVLFALILAATGCSSNKVAPRDFNELIPRLMKPVRTVNSPTEAAANLFNVTSPDERRDAIAYLQTKKYGHEPVYMRAYELLTTDPSPMVRAQAMRALASSRNGAALPYLIDGANGKTGLADPEPEVRRDAAQGFLRVFNDTAVNPLAAHLAADPDDQTRIACARALRCSHSPAACKALIAALDDKNAAVTYWARESLIESTRQKFSFDPQEWLTWYQETYPPTTHPAG